MTTSAQADGVEGILATGMGKYKSVACIYRSTDDTGSAASQIAT
jgi:hypothetical protein